MPSANSSVNTPVFSPCTPQIDVVVARDRRLVRAVRNPCGRRPSGVGCGAAGRFGRRCDLLLEARDRVQVRLGLGIAPQIRVHALERSSKLREVCVRSGAERHAALAENRNCRLVFCTRRLEGRRDRRICGVAKGGLLLVRQRVVDVVAHDDDEWPGPQIHVRGHVLRRGVVGVSRDRRKLLLVRVETVELRLGGDGLRSRPERVERLRRERGVLDTDDVPGEVRGTDERLRNAEHLPHGAGKHADPDEIQLVDRLPASCRGSPPRRPWPRGHSCRPATELGAPGSS